MKTIKKEYLEFCNIKTSEKKRSQEETEKR